jgi:hypothetical protein
VTQGEQLESHAATREAAIVGRYAILLPAGQLAFSPYDGPERTLSVAEPAAVTLSAPPPAAKAEPTQVRLWATLDRSLPVQIDAAGARHILAARKAGTLSLRLVFDLPDDATCGADLRGQHYTLGVEPVEWTWIEGAAPLARGGVSGDRPAVSVAQGAQPTVEVGEPIAGPAEAKQAVLAHRTELLGCYQQALAHEPTLDGLVVVDLGPKLAVSGDSTGSADLTGCVEKALGPLASATRSSVPIRFELAPPGTKSAALPAAGGEGKGAGP